MDDANDGNNKTYRCVALLLPLDSAETVLSPDAVCIIHPVQELTRAIMMANAKAANTLFQTIS